MAGIGCNGAVDARVPYRARFATRAGRRGRGWGRRFRDLLAKSAGARLHGLAGACAFAAVLAAAALGGGAGQSIGTPRAAGGHWHAVLAAGDSSEPVFDNATGALRDWLVEQSVRPEDIRRFSAGPGVPGSARSLKRKLLQGIAGLSARPGDRCLIFLTSHGEHGGGFYLAAADETLAPADLARALGQGCGRVPTVVIVSACYSGAFAAGAMPAANRIILTAARADRPSFGCQADRTYTFFDECLLDALPKAATWAGAFAGVRACVSGLEQHLELEASEPQASFGTAVRNLPLRF